MSRSRSSGAWLKRVVEGYYRYHAVPGNMVRSGGSENGFADTGGKFYAVVVSGGSPTGNDCGRSSTGGFLARDSSSLSRRTL